MTHLPQNLVDAPYGPHQDFIINGSFDVNQRGAVLSTSTLYRVADRHVADCSNAVDTGFSQELRDFAIGFSDVPNSPEKYMRVNFAGTTANAASHWVTYGYRIDRPLRFVNGVWTYDLWVRPQANMSVGIETRMEAQNGNPADNIAMIDPQIFPLTGGIWKRLPIKITTPVWTPASVGVEARLNLVLALSLGTDFAGGGNYVGAQDGYLDIAETSFTPGDNRHLPVIKAPRDPQADLQRCKPFYQLFNEGLCGSVVAADRILVFGDFEVEMRADPGLVLLDNSPSFFDMIDRVSVNGVGCTVHSSSLNSKGVNYINLLGFSGAAVGNILRPNNANVPIFGFDAEI